MERRGGEERRDGEKGWRDTHPYSLLNVHLHINVSAVRLPFSIRLLQHTSMISVHTHTHARTHARTHTHTHSLSSGRLEQNSGQLSDCCFFLFPHPLLF